MSTCSTQPTLPPPPADIVPWQTCPTCDGSLGSEALKWEARRLPGRAVGKYLQHCPHCAAGYVARYQLVGSVWRFVKAELAEAGRRELHEDDQEPVMAIPVPSLAGGSPPDLGELGRAAAGIAAVA